MVAMLTNPVLHTFRDPALDGPTNMARDEHLLHSNKWTPAALRLYSWSEPTISLGYFQRFDAVAELPAPERDLAVVRRATGGGAILHDRELTYCLTLHDSIPIARRAPVELYRIVHQCWADAIAAGGPLLELAPDSMPFPSPRSGPFFCFEKPGKTDLLLGGAKAMGSAQRRIPGRVMQHGSLLLGQRFEAHPGGHLNEPNAADMERWTVGFIERLSAKLELTAQPAEWDKSTLIDVCVRREKYAGAEWTRAR